MTFKLRYYQREAVDSLWYYFNNYSGNPLVAMPTGTGKSLVIATFIKEACEKYPMTRILVSTHVKEIVTQDAKTFERITHIPFGIHSAGLKIKDTINPVIFGNIQSMRSTVKKNSKAFGKIDLLIIDEAHLLSQNDNSNYQHLIKALRESNPYLKVVGFSATPWRMKGGKLTNKGGLFTDICFDITQTSAYNKLIAEGYLCPLYPKRTDTQINTDSVKITGGDFNLKQLAEVSDKKDITYSACQEMVNSAHYCKSWLVFAASIAHAEHVSECLESFGIASSVVHSKLSNEENDKRLKAFKEGKLQCLVNNDKLTTGFDHPPIDMIGVLRATNSSALWVQFLGRGSRPSEGKTHCLVLDFAQNTKRLGPVNDVRIPGPPGEKRPHASAPVKECPACGIYNHARATECIVCGHEFEFRETLKQEASNLALIADEPQIEIIEVTKVFYSKHVKRSGDGLPSMKVMYACGMKSYIEFICFEHSGYARKKAVEWWMQRSANKIPDTVIEALNQSSSLRIPARIRVWVNKPYPEILNVEW